MAVSAKEVNQLRQVTGAGMMDCKKALEEAGGDFDQAIDLLRKKGQKVSASRQDREASEGAVFAEISADGSTAVMIELNCETDFVARNDDFQGIGTAIVQQALKDKPADLAALNQMQIGGKALEATLTDAMGRIGEKLEVSKYALITGEKVACYIHPGARVGVLTAFKGANGADLSEVGKNVSMQIAAMNPIAVDKEGVDQTVLNKEIEIGKEQARAEGKPEAMLEKIAMGKLSKFLKDNTLLHQEFVKDPSKTIAQYLKEKSDKLTVERFERFHLGA
ncbi:MAG: translation elongation factor Ts [Bacteroidetes bacterium]|jgi:elongation factor Ts|nr:translation elongation factor Ts [Bacteroidota bacterium]